jgi:hypothetical protein
MTEIGWPSPFGYTEFCDDIRMEVGGKYTLVGVYQGEMKVMGVLPVLIPRLAMAIHYFEKPGEGTEPLELRVFRPTDSESAPTQRIAIPPRTHGLPPVAEGEDPRANLNFFIQFAPLEIKQPGFVRVRMKKGDDIVRLGSLRVTLATPEEMAAAGLILPLKPTQDTAPPT